MNKTDDNVGPVLWYVSRESRVHSYEHIWNFGNCLLTQILCLEENNGRKKEHVFWVPLIEKQRSMPVKRVGIQKTALF